MNGLYPIIRRVRRPLMPVDPPAEGKTVAESDAQTSKPAATDVSLGVADEKKTDAGDSNK